MEIVMINTFKSETGYIRDKLSNAVYADHVVYLSVYDTVDNFEEATKADYDAYMEYKKLNMEEKFKDHEIKPE